MNAAAMFAAAAAGRTIPKIEPNEGGPRSSWMVPPPPRLQPPQPAQLPPPQQQPSGPPQTNTQQQHSAQTQQHSLCKG